jgi:hypothetical protein
MKPVFPSTDARVAPQGIAKRLEGPSGDSASLAHSIGHRKVVGAMPATIKNDGTWQALVTLKPSHPHLSRTRCGRQYLLQGISVSHRARQHLC